MIDYVISSIAETTIMDVFEHDSDPSKHKQAGETTEEAQ